MGWILIALGIVLLALTAKEFFDGESDSIYLLDWDWIWFDLSRHEHPLLYNAALTAQVVAGIGLIGSGIAAL
ncbi:MAG: hypothetical protein AAF065_09040 [Verrucomicrobiota bacterium]